MFKSEPEATEHVAYGPEQEIQRCSPSVGQEVDLDVRIPRSAIVPDRKFFGSEHGDNQLMTNFVVPQLELQTTVLVKVEAG